MKHPNFTGLDKKQQALLTAGGWHPGTGISTPSARTLQKLLDRGFLVVGGHGYSVPSDITIAWILHGGNFIMSTAFLAIHPRGQAVADTPKAADLFITQGN